MRLSPAPVSKATVHALRARGLGTPFGWFVLRMLLHVVEQGCALELLNGDLHTLHVDVSHASGGGLGRHIDGRTRIRRRWWCHRPRPSGHGRGASRTPRMNESALPHVTRRPLAEAQRARPRTREGVREPGVRGTLPDWNGPPVDGDRPRLDARDIAGELAGVVEHGPRVHVDVQVRGGGGDVAGAPEPARGEVRGPAVLQGHEGVALPFPVHPPAGRPAMARNGLRGRPPFGRQEHVVMPRLRREARQIAGLQRSVRGRVHTDDVAALAPELPRAPDEILVGGHQHHRGVVLPAAHVALQLPVGLLLLLARHDACLHLQEVQLVQQARLRECEGDAEGDHADLGLVPRAALVDQEADNAVQEVRDVVGRVPFGELVEVDVHDRGGRALVRRGLCSGGPRLLGLGLLSHKRFGASRLLKNQVGYLFVDDCVGCIRGLFDGLRRNHLQ
mmetsp:Transcript_9133/g.15118  ORF Transcript_9133/g.15118 Transcript_9133/m.15118 type:complete len:447 (+) Transcript_9133:371-1711(+)